MKGRLAPLLPGVLLFSLLAVSVLAGCRAAPPPAAGPEIMEPVAHSPRRVVGETFVIRLADRKKARSRTVEWKVVGVRRTGGFVVESILPTGKRVRLFIDREFRVKDARGRRVLGEWRIRFPLHVGRRWKGIIEPPPSIKGRIPAIEAMYVVERFEPAVGGHGGAFRIGVFRKKTAGTKRIGAIWYAPDPGMVVKARFRGRTVYELLQYRPAPAGAAGRHSGEMPVPLPPAVGGESTPSAMESSGEIDTDIPETGVRHHDGIAVVIGNRDYHNRDIPSVDYAINDAESVKRYLVRVLGYREGNIIFMKNASKANFEAVFGTAGEYRGRLYNYLKKGKSRIFVYYSGHGAPDPNNRQGYFVPTDADPQVISITGYPLQLLYDNISKIAREMDVPSVVMVIDACFSGASEKGLLLKNASPITIEVENPLLSLPGAVVMTSSSGSEISSWYPEKRHGLFTYFFLSALRAFAAEGRKEVRASDIFEYITDASDGLPYYARRLHGRIQTPQLRGEGDVVLFRRGG